MISPEPLPPSAGLGKGLPRHGLFIRQEDIDSTSAASTVQRARTSTRSAPPPTATTASPSSGRIRTATSSSSGRPTSCPRAQWRLHAVGVGRISHGVYESPRPQRAADHFASYCAPRAASRAPTSASDTLVLRAGRAARASSTRRIDTRAAHRRLGQARRPPTPPSSCATRTSGPATSDVGQRRRVAVGP